jgi:ribose 1,5-bisphosphate isomerase
MDISPETARLIESIRGNKTDGASELARQAAGALKTAAANSRAVTMTDFMPEMRAIGDRLSGTRPAMAPIHNTVTRVLAALDEKTGETSPETLKQAIISGADRVIAGSLKAVKEIAAYSARLVTDGDRILTHSYSSTVMAALREIALKRKNIGVTVTRSGPGRTGERTVREMAATGMPLTFIDDTAAGIYLAEVSKVMVGADRICADGTLVNGAGTYQIALACRRAGIPFHVLCETLKFDSRSKGNEVDLEEKEPGEVADLSSLPPGILVRNPYFDTTPPDLITAVVTENGILTIGELLGLMAGPNQV